MQSIVIILNHRVFSPTATLLLCSTTCRQPAYPSALVGAGSYLRRISSYRRHRPQVNPAHRSPDVRTSPRQTVPEKARPYITPYGTTDKQHKTSVAFTASSIREEAQHHHSKRERKQQPCPRATPGGYPIAASPACAKTKKKKTLLAATLSAFFSSLVNLYLAINPLGPISAPQHLSPTVEFPLNPHTALATN